VWYEVYIVLMFNSSCAGSTVVCNLLNLYTVADYCYCFRPLHLLALTSCAIIDDTKCQMKCRRLLR
jgi:hypothetical protein